MSSQPPIEEFDLRTPDDLNVEHCYRHPERETGVHCSNCGRPICHECMTPAAVGFRCPDCMAAQRRDVGRARVITRQQTRGRWQQGVMGRGGISVTKVLIAINVVMFLAELVSGAITLGGGGSANELVRLGALVPGYVAVKHEYWRMLTTMFLHASLWHIFFNMLALWMIGEYVESVLGHVKFLVMYLITGLAGSALLVAIAPVGTLAVGASGAIFGIFGALAAYAYLYRNRDVVARSLLGQVVFLLILNLAFTFFDRQIAWQAHIGGLIAGVVMMAGYTLMGRKSPYGRFTGGDLVVTVAVLAVAVALTYWRVQTFPVAALLSWR
jgi:membrane associated rhomboid family serine protease